MKKKKYVVFDIDGTINIQRDLDKPAILKTQTRVTQKGLVFIQRRVFEYVENNKQVENVQ